MKKIFIIIAVFAVIGIILFFVLSKTKAAVQQTAYNNNVANNPTAKLGTIIANLTPTIMDWLKKKSATEAAATPTVEQNFTNVSDSDPLL